MCQNTLEQLSSMSDSYRASNHKHRLLDPYYLIVILIVI